MENYPRVEYAMIPLGQMQGICKSLYIFMQMYSLLNVSSRCIISLLCFVTQYPNSFFWNKNPHCMSEESLPLRIPRNFLTLTSDSQIGDISPKINRLDIPAQNWKFWKCDTHTQRLQSRPTRTPSAPPMGLWVLSSCSLMLRSQWHLSLHYAFL